MRKHWKNNLMRTAVVAMFILFLAACNGGHDHTELGDVYTCPMHPTISADKPGTCPVCGMDLVRKARPGEALEITEDLSPLIKSPNQVVVSSVKTIKPAFKSVPVSIEAVGIVTYDTRNIYTIPARVAGRVEKLFVKYQFEPIKKGQKIAEIYSPELITAQRELLFLMENDPANQSLIEGAKRRLELLGLSRNQMNDLLERKQPMQVVAVHSPHDGYAINNDVVPAARGSMSSPPSSGSTMDEMGASSTDGQVSSNAGISNVQTSFIREGDYVSVGQVLVKLVNTDALRTELNLPTAYSGFVKEGDKIELNPGTEEHVQASVDFVQPFFNQGQNFLKLRVYVRKQHDQYIGQLVRAIIELPSKESLWIPRQAVLQLGHDQVVFVKDRDVLKPKKVSTGIVTVEDVEIKSGLSSADEIAANAQYLVDSESFIKPVN